MGSSLENKIIISTRPADRNAELEQLIAESGGIFTSLPMIEVSGITPQGLESEYLKNLPNYDWLIFTSVNGVKYFLELFREQRKELKEQLRDLNIAAIGKTTAEYARENDFPINLISAKSDSKNFATRLKDELTPGKKILSIRGNLAGYHISESLSTMHTVHSVTVYETQKPSQVAKGIVKEILLNNYDIIIMSSPSGVNNLRETIANEEAFANLRLAAIGPRTAAEINKTCCRPQLICNKPYAENIVSELEQYFRVNAKNKVL